MTALCNWVVGRLSMTIALIGATGRVGSRLATELLSHGHAVTGIALHVPPDVRPGLTVLEADATRPDSLAPRLMGHDAVISALRCATSDADALIAAVKTAGVRRLLVVGGAGSLEVAPGKTLMDTDGFPDAFKTEAKARARFLENSCRSLISTLPFFLVRRLRSRRAHGPLSARRRSIADRRQA